MTYYHTLGNISVKLIGTFIKGDSLKDDTYTSLWYEFNNVILLSDFENGTIAGINWRNYDTFFNSFYETSQTYTAYTHEIYEDNEDVSIIPDWRYRIPKDDVAILNTLNEGDVVTFTANYYVISATDYRYGEENTSYILQEDGIYKIMRYGDKSTKNMLLNIVETLPFDLL